MNVIWTSFCVGNYQVQMALVPEYVHCVNSTLRGDYCDMRHNPCDVHCKLRYRSENATGSCNLDTHLCVCLYCQSQLSHPLNV